MNYTYYSIVIRHSKEPNTLRRRKKEVQNRKDLGERMIMYNNGLVDKSKNSAGNPQCFQQNSKFGDSERWHLPSS